MGNNLANKDEMWKTWVNCIIKRQKELLFVFKVNAQDI